MYFPLTYWSFYWRMKSVPSMTYCRVCIGYGGPIWASSSPVSTSHPSAPIPPITINLLVKSCYASYATFMVPLGSLWISLYFTNIIKSNQTTLLMVRTSSVLWASTVAKHVCTLWILPTFPCYIMRLFWEAPLRRRVDGAPYLKSKLVRSNCERNFHLSLQHQLHFCIGF